MDNLYVPFFAYDGMYSLKHESSGRISVDITAPAHRVQDLQNDKKKVNPRISTRSEWALVIAAKNNFWQERVQRDLQTVGQEIRTW